MTSERDITRLLQQRRMLRRRAVNVFNLNLAPMMDVMFNLLIFFLVAASFTLPEGLLEVRLPRTTGLSARPAPVVPVVPIKIFLESTPGAADPLLRVSAGLHVEAASLILARNFEDLYTVLAGLRQKPGYTADTPVIIAAKPQTAWDQVVNAYNAALRARYKHIVFASWK